MPKGLTLGNFRRESINNIMKNIRIMIDEHNAKTGKNVEYGSKPAAVWQSSSESCSDGAENASPLGSNNTCHAYASNWNLYADTKKGNRPSFIEAMQPVLADEMYNYFCSQLSLEGVVSVEKGVFGGDMKVELLNDGPITIVLDTTIWRKKS